MDQDPCREGNIYQIIHLVDFSRNSMKKFDLVWKVIFIHLTSQTTHFKPQWDKKSPQNHIWLCHFSYIVVLGKLQFPMFSYIEKGQWNVTTSTRFKLDSTKSTVILLKKCLSENCERECNIIVFSIGTHVHILKVLPLQSSWSSKHESNNCNQLDNNKNKHILLVAS